MFTSIEDVIERFGQQKYICNRRIATVVYLAGRLGKPILVEGPAGVGKTELAKVIAGALDYELIRLQCYEGLDEAKALYESLGFRDIPPYRANPIAGSRFLELEL